MKRVFALILALCMACALFACGKKQTEVAPGGDSPTVTPAARPRIAGQPLDLSQYGTIYLGYPIWWGTAPRIINTFLDSYDLTGKTIRPFCTSGSSGIETSVADIRAAVPEVNVTAGLRVDDPDGSALKAWVLG